MRQITWKTLLTTLLLLPLTSLHAVLIEQDWNYYAEDNKLLTYDTDTGLYWLDLNLTYGMTVTEVKSLISSGPFSDFTYADYATVMQFHENGGIKMDEWGPDAGVAVDFAGMLGGANSFLDANRMVLAGVTSTNPYGSEHDDEVSLRHDDELMVNSLIIYSQPYIPESYWGYWHDGAAYYHISPIVGHYLVSTSVPEPSALLLIGAGILGIGVTRLRKRR
jgi:hypothetical protein